MSVFPTVCWFYMFRFILKLWMMKGQIHEELNHLDNAREAYKQGVSEYDFW